MSDIVDRLNDSLSAGYSELRKEAAREILQLRKERDALRAEIEAMEVTLPDGKSLRITISAGVVSLAGFQTWKAALQRADEALYASKSNGRNKVTSYSGVSDD